MPHINRNKLFYMTPTYKIIMLVVLVQICEGIKWDKIRCSVDREPSQEGVLEKAQIGRYPWIGVIQYDFFYAAKMRYAITVAVRIHPWYALASAEDMVKINNKNIRNTTHFVIWHSSVVKYYMGVVGYVLHHEYALNITHASVALVALAPDKTGQLGYAGPALPICLPVKGNGIFDELYIIKLSDAIGDLRKEAIKVHYVDSDDCTEFYQKAELDYKMMVPTHAICATAESPMPACVWEGGFLLVSRDTDFYWTLLGFGVRGPGCGAPARFIDVGAMMEWINVQIAASSYYQCEDCIQRCCNSAYGLPSKRVLENKKLIFT